MLSRSPVGFRGSSETILLDDVVRAANGSIGRPLHFFLDDRMLKRNCPCRVSLPESGSRLQLAGLEVAILDVSVAAACHERVLEVEPGGGPSAGMVNVIEDSSVARYQGAVVSLLIGGLQVADLLLRSLERVICGLLLH